MDVGPIDPGSERAAALRRATLLDSAPEPTFDRLVALAARALGAPAGALVWCSHDEAAPKSRLPGADAGLLQLAERCALETCADGRARAWRDAASVPVATSDREVVGALAVARVGHPWSDEEITLLAAAARSCAAEVELRAGLTRPVDQREDQIRQGQRMEAVGRLAGGIAHDFNNLLTAILSYTELLLANPRVDHEIRDDIEQIRGACHRAANLTRQLLAYSRKQVLQPRVISPGGIVRELERMLHRLIGEDIAVEIDVAADAGEVLADPGQLQQVVVNLVVNARDAMPSGGRLTIATANADIDAESAAGQPGLVPGSYVLISVTDTGVGMDETVRARLFEPFFTTKSPGQGTGLGLSTVYGIVKQSGGYVYADSAPGRGATFRVFLPRHRGPVAGPASVDRAQRSLPYGSETILLVEDEPAVRTGLRRLLERNGYRVLEAEHGRDALRLVAGGARFDLLLTDLVMPQMGGYELIDRLAEVPTDARVLIMSGYSDRIAAGGVPRGAELIEKPFAADDLVHRVRDLLDAPRPPRRGRSSA